MNCRNCFYFPCLKFVCNLGNKSGCDEYKSVVRKELEDIDHKARIDFYEEK